MSKKEIALQKAEGVWGELDRLHRQISERAYDLFHERGPAWGGALSDWLTAERELVWKPAVEIRQKDGQFEVLAATPGVEPHELNVQITPDTLLIRADLNHEHKADEGSVHVCEFAQGALFRSVHFPERVDPESVKTEYRNGMLRLTVAAAKHAPKKVEIKAA